MEPLLQSDASLVRAAETLPPEHVVHWQFPGWGEQRRVRFRHESTRHSDTKPLEPGSLSDSEHGKVGEKGGADVEKPAPKAHSTLSQFAATALSGNDLTSSALYVISISFAQAGWLAPVCLLLVAALLYGYRFIYSEVGSALPVNGGTYTALLHTTTKGLAATAATLSLLSYAATAVVSGTDAIEYLVQLFDAEPQFYYVIGLLLVFCLLTVYGIGESAMVAIVMFVAHLLTLVALVGFTVVYAFQDGFATFGSAFSSPLPSTGGVAGAIFFGFGAALLGVSGFESSSNMIESIAPGQYPYVLRNMHIVVSVLNPLLALGTMAVLPMSEIQESSGALLATVALRSGGPVFQTILGIDAFVVLSGAVLTAFVGVSGLMERMAQDECLPQFLLSRNTCRNTPHNIPIAFFIVTASLSIALGVDVDTLSGVYTISFLCVMQLFAIGALLLKRKRPSLPRSDRTRVRTVVVALLLTFAGLLANLMGKPDAVQYFLLYAMAMGAVVLCTFQRASILRVSLPGIVSCLRRCSCLCCCTRRIHLHDDYGDGDDEGVAERICCPEQWLLRTFRDASNKSVVFFAKHADLVLLNKAVLYVRDNEQASRVVVVHVVEDGNTGEHARHALARMQLELWTGPSAVAAMPVSEEGLGGFVVVGGGDDDDDDDDDDDGNDTAMAAGAHADHAIPEPDERRRLSPAGGLDRASELRAASLAGATVVTPSTSGSRAMYAPTQSGGTIATNGHAGAGNLQIGASDTQIAALGHAVRVLDVMYPKIRLDLLVIENQAFGPGLIHWLEQSLGILSNSMFIACPDEHFSHTLGSLGGIRVISRPSRSLDSFMSHTAGTPVPRVPIFIPSPAGTDLSGMQPIIPESIISPLSPTHPPASDLTAPAPLPLGVGDHHHHHRGQTSSSGASPGRLNTSGSATALLGRGPVQHGDGYGLITDTAAAGGSAAHLPFGGSLRTGGLTRTPQNGQPHTGASHGRPQGGFGSRQSLFSEVPAESLFHREGSFQLASPAAATSNK